MVFENGVKNIQAAAYNGARTVSPTSITTASIHGQGEDLKIFKSGRSIQMGQAIPTKFSENLVTIASNIPLYMALLSHMTKGIGGQRNQKGIIIFGQYQRQTVTVHST